MSDYESNSSAADDSDVDETFELSKELKKRGLKDLSDDEVEAAGLHPRKRKLVTQNKNLMEQIRSTMVEEEKQDEEEEEVGGEEDREEMEEEDEDEENGEDVRRADAEREMLRKLSEENEDLDNATIVKIKKILTTRDRELLERSAFGPRVIKHLTDLSNYPTLNDVEDLYETKEKAIRKMLEDLRVEKKEAIAVCKTFWKASLQTAIRKGLNIVRRKGNKVEIIAGKNQCNVGYCLSVVNNIKRHLRKAHPELNEEERRLTATHFHGSKSEKIRAKQELNSIMEKKKKQRELVKNTEAEMQEEEQEEEVREECDEVEEEEVVLDKRIGNPPIIYVEKIRKSDRAAGICAVCGIEVKRLDCHIKKHHYSTACDNSHARYIELLHSCHRLYRQAPKRRPKRKTKSVDKRKEKKTIPSKKRVMPTVGEESEEKQFLALFKEHLNTHHLSKSSRARKLRYIINLMVDQPREEGEAFDENYFMRLITSAKTLECVDKVKASTGRKYLDAITTMLKFLTEDDTAPADIQLSDKQIKRIRRSISVWKAELAPKELKEKIDTRMKHEGEIEETRKQLEKLQKTSHYIKYTRQLDDFATNSSDLTPRVFHQLKTTMIMRLLLGNMRRGQEICTFKMKEFREGLLRKNSNGEECTVYMIAEHKTAATKGPAKLIVSGEDLVRLNTYVDKIRPKFFQQTCKGEDTCLVFPLTDVSHQKDKYCCHQMTYEALYSTMKTYSSKCGLKKALSTRPIRRANITTMREADKLGEKRKTIASAAAHSVEVADAYYDFSNDFNEIVDVVGDLKRLNKGRIDEDGSSFEENDSQMEEEMPSSLERADEDGSSFEENDSQMEEEMPSYSQMEEEMPSYSQMEEEMPSSLERADEDGSSFEENGLQMEEEAPSSTERADEAGSSSEDIIISEEHVVEKEEAASSSERALDEMLHKKFRLRRCSVGIGKRIRERKRKLRNIQDDLHPVFVSLTPREERRIKRRFPASKRD